MLALSELRLRVTAWALGFRRGAGVDALPNSRCEYNRGVLKTKAPGCDGRESWPVIAPECKGAIILERDPSELVDEWPLPGLSAACRNKIKAVLLRAHAAFYRADFHNPYRFKEPMEQAFSEIASILFDAQLLTAESLRDQLRLLVIESAIAGNWLYFAGRDKTQGEIFPGYVGNLAVWKSALPTI